MQCVRSGGGHRPPPQDQHCAQRQWQQCFKGKVTSKASLSPAGTGLMLSDEVLPAGRLPMTQLYCGLAGNNKRWALLGKDFISSLAWKDLAPTGK